MTPGWLDKLNPAQREAVTHGDGPLLVVAGAGTGKTRTLACRVAYLIEQGVAPERILLLTFTRRAAAEMLRRADELITDSAGGAGLGGGGGPDRRSLFALLICSSQDRHSFTEKNTSPSTILSLNQYFSTKTEDGLDK